MVIAYFHVVVDPGLPNKACNRLGYTLKVNNQNRVYFGFEDCEKELCTSKFIVYGLAPATRCALTGTKDPCVSLYATDLFGLRHELRFRKVQLDYLGGDQEYLMTVSDQYWLNGDLELGKEMKGRLANLEEQKKKEDEEVLKDSEVFDNLINITKNANEQIAEANKEIATLTETNERLVKELEVLKQELNVLRPEKLEPPTDKVHFQLCGQIHAWNNSFYQYLSTPATKFIPMSVYELFKLESYSSRQLRFSCELFDIFGTHRRHFKCENVYVAVEFKLLEKNKLKDSKNYEKELYRSRLHAISQLQQTQHSKWFKEKDGERFECPEYMQVHVWFGDRFTPVFDFMVDEESSGFGIKNVVTIPYGVLEKSVLVENAVNDLEKEKE